MKKRSKFWILTFLLLGMTTLTGCSSNDEESSDHESNVFEAMGLSRKKAQSDNNGIVIKVFERSGMKLRLVDVTDQFASATVFNYKVPVSHVPVEQLPAAIQELAIDYGVGSSTRVCRFEYKGEYYYDIYSMLSSRWANTFKSNGKPYDFSWPGTAEYEEFMSKVKDMSCILVLTTEVVKNAEGAPNYLVGYWQNDWQNLTYSTYQDYEKAHVALYPDLPFSITEVMAFNDDGTGYLRTVKTYKNGANEVALDPFSYVLTDYHGGEQYG